MNEKSERILDKCVFAYMRVSCVCGYIARGVIYYFTWVCHKAACMECPVKIAFMVING